MEEEASHDNGKALNGDDRKPLKDDVDAKKGDREALKGDEEALKGS